MPFALYRIVLKIQLKLYLKIYGCQLQQKNKYFFLIHKNFFSLQIYETVCALANTTKNILCTNLYTKNVTHVQVGSLFNKINKN